jgi:hypothetical protein
MQTHPVQNVNYWQVAAHKVGLGHRAPQRCRRLISLPTRCWREQDSNHRSRRLGFFGSGLGSARFLPLGSPFRGAGCPCGLGASRCCLALGPQLFGLIEMIEPLPSFPGRQSIAIQWGSTRPPRHGKLRGRVRVGKYLVYIVFWSGLGHGLSGPPLFIDGKLRRRRQPQA